MHTDGLGYGLKIKDGKYYIYYNLKGVTGEFEIDTTNLAQAEKTYTLLDENGDEYTENRTEWSIDDHGAIQTLILQQ